MEILKKLLSNPEIAQLKAEWERNKQRIENIPEMSDEILEMLLERAEAISNRESREEILRLAKEIIEAEEEEEVDSAISELIVQAERKKMALQVIKEIKAEMERSKST